MLTLRLCPCPLLARFLQGLAQKYIDSAAASTGTPWAAVLLDSRCHGQSQGLPGLGPPHTVESMADDVIRTLLQGVQDGRWGSVDVLLGHSIGGLIVLEMEHRLGQTAVDGQPSELVALGMPKQVWVIDSRALPMAKDNPARAEISGLQAAVTGVPEPFASPEVMVRAVEGFLAAAGVPEAPPWTAALCYSFIKLDPGGGGYVRQFDAGPCQDMLASFEAKDYRALLHAPPPGCTLHFVVALACSLWAGDDGKEELAFIRERQAAGVAVRVHEVEGTHWIPLSNEPDILAAMEGQLAELK